MGWRPVELRAWLRRPQPTTTGYARCGVEEDTEGGGWYVCTLRRGHGGHNHEHWSQGRCRARWANDPALWPNVPRRRRAPLGELPAVGP